MLGERLDAVEVTVLGVAGDRRLALRHRVSGRIASAKDPRRWRALLSLRATGGTPDTVRVTLPDGRWVDADDATADAVLSAALGEPVTLIDQVPPGAVLDRADPDEVLTAGVAASVPVRESPLGAAAPPGSFADFAPVHLVTTASLARVGVTDAVRYRPNLVVAEAGAGGFVENEWVGRELCIGSELVLRVIAPTPRCAVPTLAHGALPRAPDALRAPARLNRIEPLPRLGPQPCLGAYAQVVRPGPVAVGDRVALL
ncbi:MOSC domain-containing protein [Micromonospora sp. PLK6-60]|nr:MOSC domain-containing protein [Micromonospora sp. PLK6-60]